MCDAPIGYRIIKALDSRNHERIKDLLNELSIKLKEFASRNKYKISYKEKCIANNFFPTSHKMNQFELVRNIHFQVALEFLKFLIKQNNTLEQSILINRFIFDLNQAFAEVKIFNNAIKSDTQLSIRTFSESNKLFLFNKYEGDLSKMLFSVLGLRQSIEIRIKRILGVACITEDNGKIAKIRFDNFIKFIGNNFQKFRFCCLDRESFKNIEKIYKWTNSSVHSMHSPLTWQLWKAFELTKKLFIPDNSDPKHWNINSSVRVSLDNLSSLRKEFESFLRKGKNNKIRVYWETPEVEII